MRGGVLGSGLDGEVTRGLVGFIFVLMMDEVVRGEGAAEGSGGAAMGGIGGAVAHVSSRT